MSLERGMENLSIGGPKWYPRTTEKCKGEYYTEKQKLLVNWFRLADNITGKPIYECKVEVTQQAGRGFKPVLAMNRVKLFWAIARHARLPIDSIVYDDFETIYSHMSFDGTMIYEMAVPKPNRRPDIYRLKISFITLFHLQFSQEDPNKEENTNRSNKFLKCLFTQKFRYSPDESEIREINFSKKFINDKNAIVYIPTIDTDPKFEIAPGVEGWLGIYLGVRETYNADVVLNFGMVHKLFYNVPDMNLLDYFLILIDEKARSDSVREQYKDRIQREEYGMTLSQKNRAKHILKDLKMKATHVYDENKHFVERHVSFIEFSDETPTSYYLPFGSNRNSNRPPPTLIEFYNSFRRPIRYPNFPLVRCKQGKRDILIPIEELFVHETPQRFKNHLDFNMKTQFVRGATIAPHTHKKNIETMLNMFEFDAQERNFLRDFDISPKLQMIEVEGKVLKEPHLVNKNSEKIKLTEDVRGFKEKVLNIVPQGKLCIALMVLREEDRPEPCIDEETLKTFYTLLMDICIERGLPIEDNENISHRSIFKVFSNVTCFNGPETFQAAAVKTLHEFNSLEQKDRESKELLFIVISKRCYEAYGRIKYLCDVEYGVANQVIDESTVRRAIRESEAAKKSLKIFYNIALKINAKLNGINQEIGFSEEAEMSPEEKEARNREPLVMYVGIDVTHPTAGSGIDFSIASIVGSINRGGTRYRNMVVAQMEKNPTVNKEEKGKPRPHGSKLSREKTDILENKFVSILRVFAERNNNQIPAKIVVFRDGVSDSEMLQTAYDEMTSLKREVDVFLRSRNLNEPVPMYLYIVLQKRHKTRFYRISEDKKDLEKSDNTGLVNPKSGTVADKVVVSQYKYDFWLTSQHGALGTSRPGHYTVMYDNSGFTKDQFYEMCYSLSFLSMRCRKPISLPVPIHYAHLSCEKAKEIFKAAKRGHARPGLDRRSIEEGLQPNKNYPGMPFV